MSDISTVWNTASSYGDYVQAGASLMSGGDIETAILISIFTDRQANADDVIPDGGADRRGWWADDPVHRIGSRLWLLDRSKQTRDVLKAAYDYVVESLQWMIDDGVVARFNVYVEFTRERMLGIQVVPYDKAGNIVAVNYQWTWGK